MDQDVLGERERQHQKTLRRLASAVVNDYCNETYNKVWEQHHWCRDCKIDKFVREYFPQYIDQNGDVACNCFEYDYPMEAFRVLGFDGVIKEHYEPPLATLDVDDAEEVKE